MRTMHKWMVSAACATGLAACAGSGLRGDMGGDDPPEGGISEVPNPSPQMAAASGTPLRRLQQGHEIYMAKCGECHTYRLPANINIPAWRAGRLRSDCGSDISSDDAAAVVAYVAAVKGR